MIICLKTISVECFFFIDNVNTNLKLFWSLGGHSEGTWALEHLSHSGTWTVRHLGHSGVLYHSDTWGTLFSRLLKPKQRGLLLKFNQTSCNCWPTNAKPKSLFGRDIRNNWPKSYCISQTDDLNFNAMMDWLISLLNPLFVYLLVSGLNWKSRLNQMVET